MQFHTPFTQRYDVPIPIIQAPMAGGITTPKLVGTVSKLGALGSIGGGYLPPRQLKKVIRKSRRRARKKPFQVNLFIPEYPQVSLERMQHVHHILHPFREELGLSEGDLPTEFAPNFEEQMEVVLKEKVPFFSFTFGALHPEWVHLLHEAGTVITGTATTVKEAKCLSELGVDMICLQGKEAGGHRATFLNRPEDGLLPLEELLASTLGNVEQPLIAAGGIMNGTDVLYYLRQGACAAQMGTAFLTTTESGAKYKRNLLTEKQTTLTRAFSGRLGRALVNAFTRWGEEHPFEIIDYPIQNALTQTIRKAAGKQYRSEFLSMWAGEKVEACRDITARELLESILQDIYDLVKEP
ncbi:MAG: nitronate monooxygenase [Simkaniaceae bacterium]|nr:nitronate monooxygenase [Simkaniaceae bacterium]